MLNNHGQTNFSIGFTGLLALIFITLKLTGHIDWAWLWVLAPLWGSATLFLLVMLGIGATYMTIAVGCRVLAWWLGSGDEL